MTHEHHSSPPQDNDPLLKRYRFVFLAFLAIAFFYLAVEHTAHLFGFLPVLFLLACPLLHIFMHGGGHKHGGSGSGPHDGGSARKAPQPSTDGHQH
jgi:hypothetical protein